MLVELSPQPSCLAPHTRSTLTRGTPDFKDASPDGSVVVFETDEQLVVAHTDNSVDVYKRSGGATTGSTRSR